MQEYEMTSFEALKLAYQQGLVSRDQARRLEAWLNDDLETESPPDLRPKVQLLFLISAKPPTPARH